MLIYLGLALILFALLAVVLMTRSPARVSQPQAAPVARELPPPAREPPPSLSVDLDGELTKIAPASARALNANSSQRVELRWVDGSPLADPTTALTPLIVVSAAGQSDPGKKRKNNEDRYLVNDGLALYAVADGMGGHEDGELASDLAVSTIEHAFLTKNFEGKHVADIPKRADELVRAVRMANAAVHGRAAGDARMGTTLVCLRFVLGKQRAYIANVGDSRCYRLRDRSLEQLTTDHTWQNAGAGGPIGSLLARAIGVHRNVQVELCVDAPQVGDVYLLCSDGLTKMVEVDRIGAILRVNRSLQEKVTDLVDEANRNGGRDNVTVVLARVQLP